MSTIISIPTDYGFAPLLHRVCAPLTRLSYVLASVVFSTVVSTYHGFLVGRARSAANVPYPNAYVSHAEAVADINKYRFNCAQRAHHNFLEHYPAFLATAAVAGLKYPVATAVMGVVWSLGRVVFAKGYIGSTQEQKGSGRYKGAWYLLAELGLLGTAAWTAWQMIMG
jgi:glutathione S-transferase